jgi:hypothetical protein
VTHSKPALHPIFDQILTDFVQQEPVELQALPTRNEIYLEQHESREELEEVKIEGEIK